MWNPSMVKWYQSARDTQKMQRRPKRGRFRHDGEGGRFCRMDKQTCKEDGKLSTSVSVRISDRQEWMMVVLQYLFDGRNGGFLAADGDGCGFTTL
jgi:hypothetical protein